MRKFIESNKTTQYSVFTLYYINLHNMFLPLMVAIRDTPYLFIFLFVLTYNFVLCRFTILTSPDSNGSIESSDCLLYIIVITPEDGHHEEPKHVV
jgi:hypothetical protein